MELGGGVRSTLPQRLRLQAALNPAGDRKVEQFRLDLRAEGDKVMQIENDYDKRGLQRRYRLHRRHLTWRGENHRQL